MLLDAAEPLTGEEINGENQLSVALSRRDVRGSPEFFCQENATILIERY